MYGACNLLQHAAQIELSCGMLHPSTYDDAVCVNVLDYNVKVRKACPKCWGFIDAWNHGNLFRLIVESLLRN